jgi:hypothetical protein
MELDRSPAGALWFFSLEFLDLGSCPGFSREKEALPFAGGHFFESEDADTRGRPIDAAQKGALVFQWLVRSWPLLFIHWI